MINLNKEYGKRLKRLTGLQLIEELQVIVSAIGGCDQRTRDRGCYLIIENLKRVEAQSDQEKLIVGMLNANPEPSKGVRQELTWWEPTSVPLVTTVVACICVLGVSQVCERVLGMRSLPTLEPFMEDDEEVDVEEVNHPLLPDNLFPVAKAALLTKKKFDQAALLAERFAHEELEALTDLLMQQAVALREQELAYDPQNATVDEMRDYYSKKHTRENYVRLSVILAIRHSLKAPLIRLRSADNLNRGEDVHYPDKMSISIIINDEQWQREALQDHLKRLERPSDSHDNCLSWQSFELVKQEKFAVYRERLFSKIVIKVGQGDPWYVNILAQMGVYFNDAEWQEQVYQLTMKHLNGNYGHSVYDALVILASVHQAAQQTLETTQRPKFIMVLSG